MSNIGDTLKKKLDKLPTTPGVYFFLAKKGKKKEIVYIGKATSLRSRVKSYFSSDIGDKRGPLIEKMMGEDIDIKFEKTDSVLEALLLEAELIKEHDPVYNVKGKDQKSWNYIVITSENFPRVLIKRERELEGNEEKFGPFPNSNELKQALKIVRKIFPFRDRCKIGQKKPCFNYQIGLCPGVCIGKVDEKEYKKTIHNIKLFFQGKKKVLIKNLEIDMKFLAKKRDFESAQKIKKQIFALQHINDVALIKEKSDNAGNNFRIEAYDISHLSGTNIVGVMTVVENSEPKKSDYRKFKINGQLGADDTKALLEVLERRFNHAEWPAPSLIVIDGGKAQLGAGEMFIKKINKAIPVVSVLKDNKHKAKEILLGHSVSKLLIDKYKKEIILANEESHRFAIAFHRNRRRLKLVAG